MLRTLHLLWACCCTLHLLLHHAEALLVAQAQEQEQQQLALVPQQLALVVPPAQAQQQLALVPQQLLDHTLALDALKAIDKVWSPLIQAGMGGRDGWLLSLQGPPVQQARWSCGAAASNARDMQRELWGQNNNDIISHEHNRCPADAVLCPVRRSRRI
jgi:hypothetical protein